jgi:carbon storage regulator
MLVLTRKPGERIVIAKVIVIEVLETEDGSVRLGIQAPRNVPIRRESAETREKEEPAR